MAEEAEGEALENDETHVPEGEAAQGNDPAETSSDSATEEDAGEGGDTEGGDDDAERKPKKRGYQKRINQLTKEKHEALRAAEEARKKAAELEAQLSGGNSEPDQVDFETFEEYQQAYTKWLREDLKRELQSENGSPTEQLSPEEIALADSFNNTLIDAEGKFDDFQEVVENMPALSTEMLETALDSENAAEILYYLGNNPELANQLYELKGARLAREIGRIEAKIESGQVSVSQTSAPKKKQVTKAPAPISPTKEGATSEVDEDTMSTEEWIARRNRQVFG